MSVKLTKSQSILIIEDSEDDFEATIRAFKKANLYNPVIWCRSGQDGLDLLQKKGKYADETSHLPGLILLDLNMPGMDGRATLQHIKGDSRFKQIPVIILTTSSDERDVEICYKLGANTYAQKPVTFDGLIKAIERLKEYWFELALLPKEDE